MALTNKITGGRTLYLFRHKSLTGEVFCVILFFRNIWLKKRLLIFLYDSYTILKQIYLI